MSTRSIVRALCLLIVAASLCAAAPALANDPQRKRPPTLRLQDISTHWFTPVPARSAPEVEEVARAVVYFPEAATGFIFHDPITKTRYVMTNHHVAEAFDDSVPLRLRYRGPNADDGALYVQRWLNLPAVDLTVYEIVNHPNLASLPSLPLCEHGPDRHPHALIHSHALLIDSSPRQGVLIIGHPMIQPQHASVGQIALPNDYDPRIRHDAASLPGSSGSPIWSIDQRCVIGIHMGRDPFDLAGGMGASALALVEAPPASVAERSLKYQHKDPFAAGVLGVTQIEVIAAKAKTVSQDSTLRRTPLMSATAPLTIQRALDSAPKPSATLSAPRSLATQMRSDAAALTARYRGSVVRFLGKGNRTYGAVPLGSGVITWDAEREAFVVVTTHRVAQKIGDSPQALLGTSPLHLSLLSTAPDLDLAVFAIQDPDALPASAAAPLCAPHTWDTSSGVVFALPGAEVIAAQTAADAAAAQYLGIKQRRWQTLALSDDANAQAQRLGQTLLYDLGQTPILGQEAAALAGAPIFDPSGCVLGLHSGVASGDDAITGRVIGRGASLLPFLPSDAAQPGTAALTRLLTDRAEVTPRILSRAAAANSERDEAALTLDADLFESDRPNIRRRASACQDPSVYRLTARRQEVYTADNGHQAYLVEVAIESDPPQCADELARVIYHVGDAAVQPRYVGEPDDPAHAVRFYVSGDFTLRARLDFGDRWRQKAAVSVSVLPPPP